MITNIKGLIESIGYWRIVVKIHVKSMGPYIRSGLSLQSFVHLGKDIKFESLGFDRFVF
jgi:hypothetical protein